MTDLAYQVAEQAECMHEQLAKINNEKRKEVPLMKISEMTTANFADFVDAAGDHICNIMQNQSVAALFSSTEKKNPMRWITEAAKVLCGPCRQDVFAVLGAVYGKTAEEVAHQNILTTLAELRYIYEDVKSADVPEYRSILRL